MRDSAQEREGRPAFLRKTEPLYWRCFAVAKGFFQSAWMKPKQLAVDAVALATGVAFRLVSATGNSATWEKKVGTLQKLRRRNVLSLFGVSNESMVELAQQLGRHLAVQVHAAKIEYKF